MKKSALIIALLLASFFGFGQNNRPYVIRYTSQGDTIQHNTQAVSGIHIDSLGHELNHEGGTEWSSLVDMDTVYIYRGDEIVNPAYVPIDWENTTLEQANDSLGNYQMQFGGAVPEDLVAGSVIAIDYDTAVRYVYVESVNVNGNTVTLSSTEANLTDIFADVEFTLATNPNRRSSGQGPVFYPVAAYQRDEHGGYRSMNLNQRDLRWGFTHNLWHYGQNFDGEVLFSGNNFSVYMEHMNFDFDIDLELYMNFSGRDVLEIVGNALEVYRSRALNVNAALLGTFSTEQQVRCDIEGSCSYSPGYDIWKHKIFQPFDIKFVVYGVPVVVTLNSDLYRQVELTASGEISAYAGFSDQAQGRLGFNWRQTGGISPVASFSNTFELTPPTVEGRGTVTAKVWAIPRVRLILYHFIGPSFDFKPYLSTSVSGGFHEQMLGQTNDFCAWSLDCNTGLDAACGLSIMHPIFDGYEIENFSTPNWNIIDRPLYHSPLRIEHNANRNGIRIGQRSELSFTVYDRNHLFNTDVVTPLPQFVKFEGDGDISSEYGIADNGTVSVDWTPLSNDDVLYVRLYDVDGNVISEAEVEQDTIGDWVDLGLPSGLLWATRNVGANSPEDYGIYLSWGESQPKSIYRWYTYKYGYQIEGDDQLYLYLTKYNTDSYYGNVDNLTILQSGDDAATTNWGGGARMPTINEWQELMDFCTSVWTTQNGVVGRCFTGPNGNSLFLPAAGCILDSSFYELENRGNYWSSSLFTNFPLHAWNIYIDSAGYGLVGGSYRDNGLSVRAVRSARQN